MAMSPVVITGGVVVFSLGADATEPNKTTLCTRFWSPLRLTPAHMSDFVAHLLAGSYFLLGLVAIHLSCIKLCLAIGESRLVRARTKSLLHSAVSLSI